MTRGEFLAALTALGAAGTGECGAPAANPNQAAIVADIKRQIAAGYFSCCCVATHGTKPTAFGDRRPGDGEPVPVDADSLFEVASVSKTFTAAIAARLCCKGLLDLDAPFTRYLPNHVLAKEGTKISLRQIAAHCAGFTDRWRWERGSAWPFKSPREFEEGTLAARPSFEPGSKTRYACHNMVLLGFAIENVTGMDLDAAARKYVWEPLGMDSTSWRNQVGNPNTVRMYTHGPIPLGLKGDEAARGFDRPIGNAGVFTSANDLMKFASDILERRTFERECYDLFYTPFPAKEGRRRSFGWDMSDDTRPAGWSESTIGHAGYTGQMMSIDPVQGKAGVVLTNLTLDDSKRRGKAYDDRLALLSLATGSGADA